MTGVARSVMEALVVDVEIEGLVLTVPVPNGYEDVKSLPAAVDYEGVRYGRTGWNSDRNVAYFRSDCKVATATK